MGRAALAVVAAGQAGVVSRAQAQAAGLADSTIRRRLRSGRWQRLLPGAYATFAGQVSRVAWCWAAVLYAGRGALLSHETAAEVWGLREPAGPVHVSVPRSRRPARQPGLVVHRSTRAPGTGHPARRPPVTRVEETVVDLTQRARSLDDAVGWLAVACGRRRTTAGRLLAAVRRRGHLRWRRELAQALGDVGTGCHSVLELRYLRLVEQAHALPVGVRQAASREAGRSRYDDVRYPPWGLVVELDGRVAHPEAARRRDRDRDNATIVAGDMVLRYGWRDVTARPCAVAADVAAVLRRAGWPGAARPCSPACPIHHPRRP